MKKSILIIKQTVFTSRDYKILSIDKYIDLGYTIYIFDLTPLFYEKYEAINNVGSNYFLIFNYKSFKTIFNIIRPDFVFSLITPSINKYFIKFKILNFIKSKARIIDFKTINLPYPENLFSRTKSLIKSVVYIPWLLIKPHYSYITNIKSRNILSGKPIFGHEFDFDSYIISKSKHVKNLNFKYIIFLDEDSVFHSDFIYKNKKSPFSVEVYYHEVNEMLNYLKSFYNLNVIIQLHPRANLNISKKFYSHEISNLETADAIKNATIVVSHSSTALQFAVLFKKPIILMKVSEMTPLFLNLLNNFSKLLKTKVIAYNDYRLLEKDLIIDDNLYEIYQNTFIKYPNSKFLLSYEIINNYINPTA